MSGNVIEWTINLWQSENGPEYRYPYHSDDGREDVTASGLRVVRGGAFFYVVEVMRCAARDGNFPQFGFGSLGFRVVVSSTA